MTCPLQQRHSISLRWLNFNTEVRVLMQFKSLDDIYDTAKCIVMRGQDNQEEFDMIQDGIKKCVALFIVKSILWKVLSQMLQKPPISLNLSAKEYTR